MKKTLGLLALVLSGCYYYPANPPGNQPSTPALPVPQSYEKTYPFVENYNALEIETMIDDPREGTCPFQTFSAFWEYYHGQSADARIQTQGILKETACSLSHFGGAWLEALLFEDLQHWNKGLLALSPLFKNSSQPFYKPAFGLSYRLQMSRTTSKSDLSPEEEKAISDQVMLLQRFQEPALSPVIPYNLVIIAEALPSPAFIESLVQAYEKQSAIDSLHIFAKDSPRQEILKALQKPNSILVGYELPQPLPREYLLESVASITVGDAFVKHRDCDYWIFDAYLQLIQSARFDPFCVIPSIVFYDEEETSVKATQALQKYKHTINLSGSGYIETIQNLMALPKRQEAFQKIFPKKIQYEAQPLLLPHTILCLVSTEKLRNINTILQENGQSKTILLADSSALTGVAAQDKALQGILFWTHPFHKTPKPRSDDDLGGDLIDLICRLPRFVYEEGYVYHGRQGAYSLKNQQIQIQRWWSRYNPQPLELSKGVGIDEPSLTRQPL